jgi:eukaryotic-like serine/threonine-protein kinase
MSGAGDTDGGAVVVAQRYQLLEPMGASQQTWRAVHSSQRVEVALHFWPSPLGYRQLERGMRGWVRLLHPGVIGLWDLGVVDGAAERPRVGPWRAGWSYSVAELVGRGRAGVRLEDVRDWGALQRLLLATLDALSYAHARGVWHLNLKPGNVLCDRDVSGQGRWRLTDWALQGDWERGALSVEQARFIAPEQIVGDKRAQGAQTDLYVLGCLAYWLCEGRPPFDGAQSFEVTVQHLRSSIPPLTAPRFAVPEAFGAWVQRMTHRALGQRMVHAAEAARGLLAMPSPPAEVAPMGVGGMPTLEIETLTGFALNVSKVWLPAQASQLGGAAEVVADEGLPRSWRPLLDWHPQTHVRGVGLELLARRQLPPVGHEQARDALWGALTEAVREGEPRAVWLTGAEGDGKRALGLWLRRRVNELGVATALELPQSALDAPGAGILRTLDALLKTWGLDAAPTKRRAQEALEGLTLPEDAAPKALAAYLTQLLRVGAREAVDAETIESSDAAGRVDEEALRALAYGGLGSVEQRARLLTLLLHGMARRRPVLLCVEVPSGCVTEGALLVEHLICRSALRPLPILCVLIDIGERASGADAALPALAGHPALTTVALAPLPNADLQALLTQHLGAAPALAASMAADARGSALLTALRLEDALERGDLLLGRQGFRPRDPAQPWPDDLNALWMQRVNRLLQQWPDHEQHIGRFVLEIAAALGAHVENEVWRAVCRSALMDIPEGLVAGLVCCGLARDAPWGWSFRHDTLRRSLEADARRRGRWSDHHRRCAAYWMSGPATSPWACAEGRRARHLLAAGDAAAALEPLRRAITRADADGNALLKASYIQLLQDTVAKLPPAPPPLPQPPPLAAPLALLAQADEALGRGELASARRIVSLALASAVRSGHATAAVSACLRLGHCLRRLGQSAAARPALKRLPIPPAAQALQDLFDLEVALCDIHDGHFRDPAEALEPILPRAHALPAYAQLRYHLARACCAAARFNPERLREAWSRLPRGVPAPDAEMAALATRTGNFAIATRNFVAARPALKLALTLWEGLEQHDEYEKVRFTLQQISRW